MLSSIAIFVIAVGFLVASAKFFTQAAEILGYRAGLSPFVIGVVIVSVGTSLPELISAIVAAKQGGSEIVAGNVIGSSLSNILFVLGLTVLLSPKRIDLGSQYIYIDLNYLAGAALIVVVTMYDGAIHFAEALLGLIAYAFYVFYLIRSAHTQSNAPATAPSPEQSTAKPVPLWKPLSVLVVSGIVIYLSANQTISALATIAESLGVSKAIVSITLLSIGTTLPECVVSVTAARQGKAELAVGNVLGSCIFNSLAIPGVAACFGTLDVPAELISFSLPVYGGVVLLFYLLTQDKKVSHFEGALFLLIYILFIGKVSHLL
jgi:cation:H+ antiporter